MRLSLLMVDRAESLSKVRPQLTRLLSSIRLDFISSAPSLEILRLNNNGMGSQGGAMIAGALLENAKKAEKDGRKSKLRVLVCGASRLSGISSLLSR